MNNNVISKESIQLLNATSSDSDSLSETHFAVIPPQPPVQVRRKIRTKRKSRRDGSPTASSTLLPCSTGNLIKAALISFVVGAMIFLGWVVVLLHSEVQQLSQKLSDVPIDLYNEDTILDLKRIARDLSANQTSTYLLVQKSSRTLDEFQKKTASILLDVSTIKESLKEAPQMLNIGKELDSLKNRIATYEAIISDLKLSLKDLRDSSNANIMTVKTINSTLQSSVDSAIKDLHLHHSLISSLEEGLRNVTQQLIDNKPTYTIQTINSDLEKLRTKQKNNTHVLDYLLKTTPKMDPLPLQRKTRV